MIMREAGRINALAIAGYARSDSPRITTHDLDLIAADVLRKHGAKAAFWATRRQVPPYPATITASINNELVHGIPSPDRVLQEGDIISLDCGTIYNGYVGDSAFTAG
jgi:methionyl aminopeptidase